MGITGEGADQRSTGRRVTMVLVGTGAAEAVEAVAVAAAGEVAARRRTAASAKGPVTLISATRIWCAPLLSATNAAKMGTWTISAPTRFAVAVAVTVWEK